MTKLFSFANHCRPSSSRHAAAAVPPGAPEGPFRAITSPKTLVVSALLSLIFLVLPVSAFPSARADTAVFQTYRQQDGLASDYVNSIAVSSGTAAWIGTPLGATNVRDKYWVSYTAAHGLGNTAVSAIAVGSDGRVYLATSGGGLTLFDAARKTLNTGNSAIPGNYLTAAAVDKQNRVWVGTFGAGVGRLENDHWTKYSLADNYVNALALDASGNPWVATNDGAFFYDGQTWTRFTQTAGLAGNHVNTLAVAPDGRIWFGTSSGLTVYDGRRYKTYKESDGLANNSVRAIAVDAQNRAWIGTLHGLSLLDGSTWKTYTAADGLPDDEVTALGLDSQKNVWVGTPHGLGVLGATWLQRANTVPVVLVHGWHGPESDRFEDSEFRYLKDYLDRDGITPFYATGILPTRTLFQNAATLRDVIAGVRAATGAPRVDIIAFSMGGLNARAYLESSLYQGDVRRAIILGTPQAGVQTWYPLLTREIQDLPDEPSTIELTPEYANLFNRTHAPRASVPYDLLVGDADSQPGLDFLKNLPPGDGLIDEWSAHALAGPQVRRIVNSDIHAWDPEPLPLAVTSYLYPEQTYERFLRNALRDPDSRPIGFAAPPAPPVSPRNITPLNVDTLRAGESVTRTVDVDAARATRFFSRWTGGDVTLTLRAPDGTRYAPTDLHQASYLKADIGNFIGYAITRTLAGPWTVVATRNDKGTAPITVTTYADLDSNLRLNASMSQDWYRPGASPVISATLSNRASNADVRARVEWLGDGTTPRGAATEIKLLAEGDPGYYGDTLADLKRGGYYLLHVTARGPGYARERQLLFSISPGTAQFSGSPSVHVEGAAGQYSALVIDAPVTVNRAGAFALAATLRSAKGDIVGGLTSPVTLTQDARTATVSIPGRDLRARGLDGPYTVDLVLMDAGWAAVQVDQSLKAITTDAYRASDFGE